MRAKLIVEWQRFIAKAHADATWERQTALDTALLGLPSNDASQEALLALIAIHQANALEQDRMAELGEQHLEEFRRTAHAA